MRRPWITGLAIFAAYTAMVLLVTYPTILELGQGTLGEPGVDKQNHLWDFWWWYQAARDPARSFLFTDLLYYPPGVSLWHANSGFTLFFFGLIPQAMGFGVQATYDLVVISSLLITCLGGYVLGVRLFRDRGVGFFCGAAAAFNPLLLQNINLALVEFVNLGFALLFIAALHCLVARASWRDAVQAVIWFMLAATWSWYMGLLLVLFTALYVPITLGVRGALDQRRRLLLLGGMTLAIGLFLLPFYLKIGVGSVEGRIMKVERQVVAGMAGRQTRVVDRARFLAREGEQLKVKDRLCMQALEVKLITSIDPVASLAAYGNSDGHRMAPFFPLRWAVPLLLAAVGLILGRRRWSVACAIIAVSSLLLALGPCLIWNDKIIWDSCPMMPFSLLDGLLPGLSRVQFPQRLIFLASFALVMLAGQGLRTLLEARGRKRGHRAGLILVCTALTLVASMDTAGFPMSRGRIAVPEVYRQQARAPRGGAMVEVPLSLGKGVNRATSGSLFSFYQTVHGQPIHTGPIPEYLSPNVWAPDMLNNALLARIRVLEQGPPFAPETAQQRGSIREGVEALRRHGFSHILVHTAALTPPTARAIQALLNPLVGLPRREESVPEDPMEIFTVPTRREGER